MQELTDPLGGDTEQKKLLVEIVQGLLMAHARLDAMDEALRRTVESASREHLKAFTEELRQVDARFQKSAGQVDGTLQSLHSLRDNLVRSVEASTAQHAHAFNQQVVAIQKSIQEVRTLDRRLTNLTNCQTAHGDWAEAQARNQSTNWTNLHVFLQSLQLSLNTAHTELTIANGEIKKKVIDDGVAVGTRFAEIKNLIGGMDASHLEEMRRIHVRLNWFIFLALVVFAEAFIILYLILLR